ncbi:MAG: HD domain-containing protein, partial [Candidatus Omnitrophica bacterium]|nr:HD domain-containing protein [Candidatus Omnitrophota bacterium]
SERITRYAISIAKKMALSQERVEEIKKAVKLHELGKLGVHDCILTKPGKLSSEEWKEVKAHFLEGVMVLKPLKSLGEVIKIIEQHHERFDGKGYPCGIKGQEILLEARIVAVADAFGAMTVDRPYRPALSAGEAIEELGKNRGTQFDPAVVDAFISVFQEDPTIV